MSEEKNGKSRQRRESCDSEVSNESVSDLIPTPPDGGWGWVIVLASFMCNVIVDGIGYAYGVLLPEFAEFFNAPRSKVSLVGSLLCGVYLLAGPIVSGLTNKFGCRKVTIVGSVIAAIGFIIGSFSPSLNVLIVSYGFLGGFGFGLIYLPSIVSVGYYFEKKRALATGIAVCGSGVGTFIFSPGNNALLAAYDWRGLLLIHSAIILQCAVCGMLMRPLEPEKKKKVRVSDKNIDRIKEEAKSGRKRCNESESSVAVVETFAKLREAKLKREKQLEDDSDIASMPSAYFVKGPPDAMSTSYNSRQMKLSFSDRGDAMSQTSTPAGPPKIMISENGSNVAMDNEVESPTSNMSLSIPDRKNSNSTNAQQEECDQKDKNNSVLPNGVFAHEVQPLIENGYTKVAVAKPKPSPSGGEGGSKLCVGSSRDVTLHKEDYKRPLYRKDIFYSGSVLNIPQYRSQPDMRSYIASITTIPGDIDQKATCWDKCTCLPKSVVDTLSEMLDISLLTNVPFLLICVGNLFAMTGFYVPFTYIVDRAVMLGIDSTRAAFLLSIIGITNTIGRVLSGFLADLKFVDSLVINNIALVISAVSLFLQPLCTTYETLIIFAAVYGLCVAAYISLTSIIICDLLGLEKLTNAFGLLTMARGIAGIYGPPVAGLVFQEYGSYDASFYMGGFMFTIGSFFHLALHLPCLKRMSKQRETEAIIAESTHV
ncbi:monocarboxylate transporter 14-like [Ylistrum balloti]|uniref:monocarboxylate transporter 14-like n=1 Tax=Ylistrum balloti TaxID=509963 RepID=UPI002905E0AB|nr:monocarboxylate transporter 14-like [Ylistrum balloti]XP_060073574.1 monocarboxylate transporter 14-like [Ylistrum balloti]XP_060073575.1 monocarboxylate transporter 14-like [Ylistrum balloti]